MTVGLCGVQRGDGRTWNGQGASSRFEGGRADLIAATTYQRYLIFVCDLLGPEVDHSHNTATRTPCFFVMYGFACSELQRLIIYMKATSIVVISHRTRGTLTETR